ncbi:ATP-binding protein [Nitratidesulfovibrio sp. SRB-5]|uniref:PAS domain-containing sensor histidine kinase n=1 Tax=Nitratidesulfovibrio sp. SRB-5 TaxID=2872636 RepID=UPI001027035D|nr:ATP-binding protein [Nitratidesulfovibrio sp. SRB-5]MBZ2171718.1 PAS domain-containing protein [Nitratidesulfovibrio sp. SRB-5]RXF78697.1 PAS domain-containing protein [Desulfovibrio sp. DS-1]
MTQGTSLDDLIGIEHSKLGFFQELRQTIEQLKAAHRDSERNRLEIEAILDGITDLMMVLSKDLRIIAVNHVFYDILGVRDPEGRYCYEIFRHQDHPCPECPAHRSFVTDEVCRETSIFRINGRKLQFEMVASPIKDPATQDRQILIFKRDVTLEKEFQAKFHQAEKMATVGMLAAGVAHEVNNPLTAIHGFAEGILRRVERLRGIVDPEMHADLADYAGTILGECGRCQEIVHSLLTFSRPHSSEFSPVNLNVVVGDTLKLLHNHLKQPKYRRVRIDARLCPTAPVVLACEAQLKQVMLNLLVNALDAFDGSAGPEGKGQAGPPKGDTGSVDGDAPDGVEYLPTVNGGRGRNGVEAVITVTPFRDGRHAGFVVRDTGSGIPPEHLDSLFEPFFTTKPVGRGIGIGLSTCYTIVTEHGGDIRVESRVGEGSTFTVTLPLPPE